MAEIDVSNSQMVGMRGDFVVIAIPRQVMTRAEALQHAAWLVAVADDDGQFPAVLEAVQRT